FRYYYGTPVIGNSQALISVPSQIKTDNYLFKIISLPGHSNCSLGYYEQTEKWFFTGDAIPLPEKKRDSSIGENMTGLLNSLQKIAKMDISVLFTGHCGVKTEVTSFIQPRLTWLEEFQSKVRELAKEGFSPKQIRKTLFGREKLYTYLIHGEHSCLNSILSFLTNKRPVDLTSEQIKELDMNPTAFTNI
ncbi:MAG: MBL fold metallo-hydrolase, partial [Candidatus Hodarchaeota archaeon]